MYDIEVQTNRSTRLYPEGETLSFAKVIAPDCWVLAQANDEAARLSQYTFGEGVRILEEKGKFSYVQSLRDHYSGWVLSQHLQQSDIKPKMGDYRTMSIATIHCEPNMKSTILTALPPDACVDPIDKKEGYCLLEGLGWINRKYLCRAEENLDPVDFARTQIGRSYVWGGRGILGLDCSALTQLCYRFAGRNIPRDSDLQAHFLKATQRRVELCELERGDLIFLPDHVMIAADAYTVIHANAHHMRVVVEDLKVALSRSEKAAGGEYFVRCYRWQGNAR